MKLSWLIAVLKGERIEAVALDRHTSVLEGSGVAIPVRLMVDEADEARARRLMEEIGALDGGA